MADIASRPPVADHFLTAGRQSENYAITPSSFPWDQSLCGDLAQPSSQSCDTFPGFPNSPPSSNSKHVLSSQESDLDQTLALSFLLEDFDNSIGGWDDPTNSAFSLLVESPSGTPNLEHPSPEMDPTELHVVSPVFASASLDSARISNEMDDSVPFEDSMNDEPQFQSRESLDETSDVPPHDGLYSTPLSWERPKLGFRVGNCISYEPLSPEEESRLLAIAMPAQSRANTPPLSPSPEPQQTCKRISRKRRSSESSESDFPPARRSRHLGPQKTAHHMVEKRYRTNLNQKIAALRDSVPSLRVFGKDNPCSEDLKEDLQGLSQAKKLNKATILTKAVEYIVHLEKRNKCLTKEIQALKSHINGF